MDRTLVSSTLIFSSVPYYLVALLGFLTLTISATALHHYRGLNSHMHGRASARCARYRHLDAASGRCCAVTRQLRPVDPTSLPTRPDISAHSTRHLCPLDRTSLAARPEVWLPGHRDSEVAEDQQQYRAEQAARDPAS